VYLFAKVVRLWNKKEQINEFQRNEMFCVKRISGGILLQRQFHNDSIILDILL
jgi:hypothetical protein